MDVVPFKEVTTRKGREFAAKPRRVERTWAETLGRSSSSEAAVWVEKVPSESAETR